MEMNKKSAALKFVLIIGVLSFFADFTYEGSRSVLGPYLALLGASATAWGLSPGSANCSATACDSSRGGGRTELEIFGRSRSSATSCRVLRCQRSRWHQLANGLPSHHPRTRRKAIRNPPRDTMLSHAAKRSATAGRSGCMRRWINSARSSGLCRWRRCWLARRVPFCLCRAAPSGSALSSPLLAARGFYPRPKIWRVKRRI